MKSFPQNISFKYPWRSYQQRVLDNLQDFVQDGHLHIVAPPGSGKTVLGLEVMLRTNKPTLIVSPTLAIKNQWIQRFTELFLQTDSVPDWISTDIKNPKLFTVTTYQGIHAACSNLAESTEEEPEEDQDEKISKTSDSKMDLVIKNLQKAGIKTFILDEAHHLKKAWWQSLIGLKDALNPLIVALTATPPYDVSGTEWKKYVELNGPVDAEISVPELMLEKDLCPHQDLVYFTLPTPGEQQKIETFHKNAERFFREAQSNETLLELLQTCPLYISPMENLEWIYENVSSYTCGLVYMKHRGKEIEDVHFDIIGDEQKYIPEFNFFWFEELLDFLLKGGLPHFKSYENYLTDLENRLKRHGFLEKGKLSFFHNSNITSTLNSSIGKLEGIKEIADFEFSSLGDKLRMVILTDYIRKEFLSKTAVNDLELTKIGAVSIFEKLRRENSQQKKIGILTGSLVIIPKSAADLFRKKLESTNPGGVALSELTYDSGYVQIAVNDHLRHSIVHLITEIFQEGEIQILIGTKSLLGEGWDAPKINSLVLATFVSSFVQSNQMRGRAIRLQNDDPHKTGNIWHLVCFDAQSETGGDDFDILRRRFKTFVGVSNSDSPTIENNYARLQLPLIGDVSQIPEINEKSLEWAGNRKNMSARWTEALDGGKILVEQIKIPFEKDVNIESVKSKYLTKTIANFGGVAVSAFLMFWSQFLSGILKSFIQLHSLASASPFIIIFGIAGLFTYGPTFYRALKQYLKYKNIAKHISKIASAVVISLRNERIIRTPAEKLRLVSNSDFGGNTYCHLEGATNYEKSQFILTLQELFSPVDNPRYLLQQRFLRFFKGESTALPVPEIFGKNKRSAEFFCKTWCEEVENVHLIFTRTPEGRKILLKQRFQFLMKKNKHIEHMHKWIR